MAEFREPASKRKRNGSSRDSDEENINPTKRVNVVYTEPMETSLVEKHVRLPREESQDINLFSDQVRTLPVDLPNLQFTDVKEMWQGMLQNDERMFKKRCDEPFQNHDTLFPRMRVILFDWLSEVCDVYKLRRETYFLAMDYVDRFLSMTQGFNKTVLQLLGVTCLFLASKMEEIYPPKINNFAYITDGACTEKCIIDMEAAVLSILNWDLTPITINGWLIFYMQLSSPNKTSNNKPDDSFLLPKFSAMDYDLAIRLCNLSVWDEGVFRYSYSVIAAASLYFIRNKECAIRYSSLQWEQIESCVKWMEPFASVVRGKRVSLLNGTNSSSVKHACSFSSKILYDEAHIIQKHTVTLDMFDHALEIAADQMQTERSIVEDTPSRSVEARVDIILTPPTSVQKDSISDTDIL